MTSKPTESEPPFTPAELTEAEQTRLDIQHDAWRQAVGAIRSGDEDGAAAALGQFLQIPTPDTARTRDAFHMPPDAGDQAEGIARIFQRIPDGWGRWLSLGKGWYPIVVELNDQLTQVDSRYQVHQVKQKFGYLRYYYRPSSAVHREVMNGLVRQAEALASRTCEVCGAMSPDVGLDRRHYFIQTLCQACGDAR